MRVRGAARHLQLGRPMTRRRSYTSAALADARNRARQTVPCGECELDAAFPEEAGSRGA
jgi:hypothetical protein